MAVAFPDCLYPRCQSLSDLRSARVNSRRSSSCRKKYDKAFGLARSPMPRSTGGGGLFGLRIPEGFQASRRRLNLDLPGHNVAWKIVSPPHEARGGGVRAERETGSVGARPKKRQRGEEKGLPG
jgi:hypothetical protein